MSLNAAVANTLSGLRASQLGISLISGNVANAETAGYVRKSLNQVAIQSSTFGASAYIVGVNRELNSFLQSQLRTETSGAAYAGLRTGFLSQLQGIYGDPGSAGTLEYGFAALASAAQALSTSADSQSARITLVTAAQAFAQQLNSTTQGIQALRGAAENGITDAVNIANNALQQIAKINNQLRTNPAGGTSTDSATSTLLDQRDQYITQLSQVMDIRVLPAEGNKVSVFTGSGVQLVGNEAVKLSFNGQGTVNANSVWDPDPAKSTLGTISINYDNGSSIDLISAKAIRSGSIAAYLELRDVTLVQAQAQLDQFASQLASGLSDRTTNGAAAPASVLPQTGFDVDLAGLQSGNVVRFTYTNSITGAQHKVSIVRVDDPSVLPLANTTTADPGDEVIGINFSGGIASVVAQLNSAFGSANVQFSNPSGSVLRILDDGAAGFSDVNAASVTVTQTSLINGGLELPLFTDNNLPYTGAITAQGAQVTGLAGRIGVSNALIADPSRLVVYSTAPPTAAGDTSRSDFILDKLTTASYTYAAGKTGIGSTAAPFKGTLIGYIQQFTAVQGAAAEAAAQLSAGQDVVLNTLQKKLDDESGVNIDEEMAHLLSLQNAYAANARVLSTIKDVYTVLLQAI
ncbi:MAG: flagellar hook-associated protein FlgK [Pseudomonadota bacterium]|jgi:flagellar hook-associated protein 1 FlgK